MADNCLADFFAAHHDCSNYTLYKAVMHCASRADNKWPHDPGLPRDLLRRAAYAWQPATFMHCKFKQLFLAEKPEPLKRTRITPPVTRVRKALEAHIYNYYHLAQQPETIHG